MSRVRLRKLMQDAYDTNSEFHKEIVKGERWQARGVERKEIVAARDRSNAAFNLLFSAQLTPMRASFLQEEPSSIDKVIDFLEIDIPVFRCGYEKEWYLGKLKSILLTQEQQGRLKKLALDLVSAPRYRRERRDWSRLMIVLADKPFIASLRTLSNFPEHFIQQNARRMLKMILDNRQDLGADDPSGEL